MLVLDDKVKALILRNVPEPNHALPQHPVIAFLQELVDRVNALEAALSDEEE